MAPYQRVSLSFSLSESIFVPFSNPLSPCVYTLYLVCVESCLFHFVHRRLFSPLCNLIPINPTSTRLSLKEKSSGVIHRRFSRVLKIKHSLRVEVLPACTQPLFAPAGSPLDVKRFERWNTGLWHKLFRCEYVQLPGTAVTAVGCCTDRSVEYMQRFRRYLCNRARYRSRFDKSTRLTYFATPREAANLIFGSRAAGHGRAHDIYEGF